VGPRFPWCVSDPAALATLTERGGSGGRATIAQRRPRRQLWPIVQRPQWVVPAHVVRVQARLVGALLEQLGVTVGTVDAYREAIADFFGACRRRSGRPAARREERDDGPTAVR